MNKLTMPHEYAMKCIGNPNVSAKTNNEIIAFAWAYADLMQDEADKREVGISELMKDHVHDYIYGRVCACGALNGAEKEWQPDWGQAPSWANWWAMDGFVKNANWYIDKPYLDDDSEIESEWNIDLKTGSATYIKAPLFNYQGNWQDSLRKRPQ